MRRRAWLLLLLIPAAVWWFTRGQSDYPKAWPKPAGNLFSRKGGCPDLEATYTEVGSELPWLLSRNPDFFGSPRPVWRESRAAFTQARDGSTLTMTFSLSPKGFDEYRERMIKYNSESNGSTTQPITLKRGQDFECEGGWLYNKYFPQDGAAHGWERRKLQVGRDRNGGLIAGATIAKESTFGWGDSRGISLGSYESTSWYRWPKDDPDSERRLKELQSVDLHRYWWKNQGGTAMPIRFTSFYLEPICVRLTEIHSGGLETSRPRSGPETLKSEIECPKGWGKFDLGEVLREEMDIQTDTSHKYRIEWYPWSARESKPNVIEVVNVHELPEMPRCQKRGDAGC